MPKSNGSVEKSQVYIVGGTTELNYNLSSGGVGVEIAGSGPRVRKFTISVAADLRLVNTTNLNMIKSVSLRKQVVGYEVKAGVFRFFSDNLYNIETGVKSQELLQLAVRTVLEMATLELVSKIYSIDYTDCFDPMLMKASRIKKEDNGTSPRDLETVQHPHHHQPPAPAPVSAPTSTPTQVQTPKRELRTPMDFLRKVNVRLKHILS